MKGSVRKKRETWYYRITIYIDGKPKYIERKGGRTKAEAEKALRAAISEYEGTDDIRKKTEIQFEEYLLYWFDNYVMKELRYRTQQDYRNIICNHFIPYFKNYKLKAITPELLQNYLYNKKESGLARNTLIGHYGTLSKSLRMAVYPYKFISDNPMQYISMPRYDEINKIKESEKIISFDDWKKIQKRFPVENHFGLALNILYYAALRESEMCALTWDDVDFKNMTISINHQMQLTSSEGITSIYFAPLKTKSSYGEVAIGDTLKNILIRTKERQDESKKFYNEYYMMYYMDKNNKIYSLPASEKSSDKQINFICTKENGEVLTTNTLKYCARVIHHEMKIDNFTFHRLRHTHASILISNGANIKAVQDRLRHKNITTTMNTYSHLLKETKTETANIFDKLTK